MYSKKDIGMQQQKKTQVCKNHEKMREKKNDEKKLSKIQ